MYTRISSIARRAGFVLVGLSVCVLSTGITGVQTMAEEALGECFEGGGSCDTHTQVPVLGATIVDTAPIACTLADPNERARRTQETNGLVAAANEIVELDNGFRLQFDSESIDRIVDYVRYERKCCAFLRFSIEFEPNNGPVWLSVTGSRAAKLFMRDMFTTHKKAEQEETGEPR